MRSPDPRHQPTRIAPALALAVALAAAGGPATPARASDMAGSFSVVLRDPATGELGVAALSHAPACGAWVPWVDARVGAVAVQGDIEPSWGPRALELLAAGLPAQQVVDSLRGSDPGSWRRQIGVVDRAGRAGGYTGPHLVNWSGGWLDSNFAVQGNTMPGSQAFQWIVDSLSATRGAEIAARLFRGLALARAVKADFRGARSAVLVIGRPNPDRPEDATRYVSLRVDDDPDPVAALAVLYRNWRAGRLVAARLDDAARARARGAAADGRAATAEALAMARAALADSTTSPASLNAMAWALAQHDTGLDEAWSAIGIARRAEPRSNEYADTAAEIRLRQGRAREAWEIERDALARVPLDEYLRDRVEILRQKAGLPREAAPAEKAAPRARAGRRADGTRLPPPPGKSGGN